MPLPSMHKYCISVHHYRQINLSVNKKTTIYKHYQQNNPSVITTKDIVGKSVGNDNLWMDIYPSVYIRR